jgi:hypothetical protein
MLHRYSITSSARASSVGGTSSPSVLAVLRLITSSNLVGCSTERSPGFAPLRGASTDPKRLGHLQDTGTLRKLWYCSTIFARISAWHEMHCIASPQAARNQSKSGHSLSIDRKEARSVTQRCRERVQICTLGMNWSRWRTVPSRIE